MKKILAVLLFGALLQAEDLAQQLGNLADQMSNEKSPLTGRTIDEDIAEMKKRVSFNRAEWEEERRKYFEGTKRTQRQKPRNKKKSEKLIEISSRALSDCAMVDRFRKEKANGYNLEVSPQREEIKQYWEFLKSECEKSEAIWDEYLRAGGK